MRSMIAHTQDFSSHIEALCREHGIQILVRNGSGGRAHSDGRKISIPLVKSEVTYWLALHEIGHLVEPGAIASRKLRLTEEGLAWKWALNNSLIPCSDVGRRKIYSCISSYLRRTQRSAYMKAPPEGDIFWTIYEWCVGYGPWECI